MEDRGWQVKDLLEAIREQGDPVPPASTVYQWVKGETLPRTNRGVRILDRAFDTGDELLQLVTADRRSKFDPEHEEMRDRLVAQIMRVLALRPAKDMLPYVESIEAHVDGLFANPDATLEALEAAASEVGEEVAGGSSRRRPRSG